MLIWMIVLALVIVCLPANPTSTFDITLLSTHVLRSGLLTYQQTYLPLFMDPGAAAVPSTGTEAPAPQVPA